MQRYSDMKPAETVAHAFITSLLDYCNAFLYGLSKSQLKKLQYFLTTLQHVLWQKYPENHIKSILKNLHWLPIIESDSEFNFTITDCLNMDQLL